MRLVRCVSTVYGLDELLDGLLGNDVLGFHLRYHCANFLETVDRGLEALVDTEHSRVIRTGHATTVRPFPISIDFAEHVRAAASSEMAAATAEWIAEIGCAPEILGIGIDRVHYTKGISERQQALDCLLEERPEYEGRLCFVQVAVPGRTAIPVCSGNHGLEIVGQGLHFEHQRVRRVHLHWRRSDR
jgi:trehalose-6-phosphate synthase